MHWPRPRTLRRTRSILRNCAPPGCRWCNARGSLDAANRRGEAHHRRSIHDGHGNERLHQSAHAQRRTFLGSFLVRKAFRSGARMESRRSIRARRRSKLSRDRNLLAFARSCHALRGMVCAVPLSSATTALRTQGVFATGLARFRCFATTRLSPHQRALGALDVATYNVYLKSNRIAAGLENYDEVTRLMLGVPRDREGLPLLR